MEKRSVYRFVEQHLQALKDGAVQASLTSGAALLRRHTEILPKSTTVQASESLGQDFGQLNWIAQ